MNLKDHYQALYDTCRDAMDNGDKAATPLLHVFSGDDLQGRPYDAPFVMYRQDVERPIGTTGGGAAKVLRSSWVFTAFTADLPEGLDTLSLIATALNETGPSLVTDDGYTTTHFAIEGVQTLYDQEANLYASHLRIFWERSA